MIVLGPARLDLEKQELSVGARTVVLQRKPYVVLLYLIENRHRMVYRKELLDRFWDGKEVYDQSLSKAVGSIRRALGDEGSELIETRWGLGYRYIGPFSESSQQFLVASPLEGFKSASEDAVDNPRADAEDLRGNSDTARNEFDSPEPSAGVPRFTLFGHPARAWSLGLLSVALVVLVLVAFAMRKHDTIQHAPGLARSVAVLPFSVSNDGGADQYLALELSDAVTAKLATVPQLTVRSSSTVRSIPGVASDTFAAGKKLGVGAVVRGEIHHDADKAVVQVQLVDCFSGADLWSGSFNTANANIFAIEDSISQQVSSALLPSFTVKAPKRLTGPDTTHPEAYSAYMKARFFATTRTRSSIAKAIMLLNEAIAIDPSYARAYAALADCYQLQGFYEFVPAADAYPRAKAAALKALSLDDSLVEAHVSLLSTFTDYDWDAKGVEREFRASIAIDPNYAVAYQYYGYALLGMGRGTEALVAMRQAAQLDPVSPSVQASLAWAYFLLRRYQESVDQCKRVLELYPDFVPAHQLLGIVYGQMRLDQKAIAELDMARGLEGDNAITPVLIAYELARTGRRVEAARNLASISARPGNSSSLDYYQAAAWTANGDKQRALVLLDRALRSRSNWIIYLNCDPRFDDLRADPRFKVLLYQTDFSRTN